MVPYEYQVLTRCGYVYRYGCMLTGYSRRGSSTFGIFGYSVGMKWVCRWYISSTPGQKIKFSREFEGTKAIYLCSLLKKQKIKGYFVILKMYNTFCPQLILHLFTSAKEKRRCSPSQTQSIAFKALSSNSDTTRRSPLQLVSPVFVFFVPFLSSLRVCYY